MTNATTKLIAGALSHSLRSNHHSGCRHGGQYERCTCHVGKAYFALAALEGNVLAASELWDDNLTAWEGEEDSVKGEHAELIERLQSMTWQITTKDGFKAEWIEAGVRETEVMCREGTVNMPPVIRVTGPGLVAPMEFISNGEDAIGQLGQGIEIARKMVEFWKAQEVAGG